MEDLERRALEYHELNGRAGKIEVRSTKPLETSDDLSLAYTPGVAKPVLRIESNPSDAYRYTDKGNLVAVITNGTAILGLGDRGPLASKPVMEGKAVLFKAFAGIDVFDIEIDEKDPERLIDIVASLSPTFGGINLEDIKAPECFRVENELRKRCPIPVFHDDQHGTAIIAAAGLMNAAEVVGKRLDEMKVVVNGAGAAGVRCAEMFLSVGVRRENLTLCDKSGVVRSDYPGGIREEWRELLDDSGRKTLSDAIRGADMFMGVSAGGVLKKEMLLSMAADPIVFAMANPDPEIRYEDALEWRKDAVVATGRSDYPNQINNVLGFPGIFRGALDSRSSEITEGMMKAAASALAKLAKEEVPPSVSLSYGGASFSYGRSYLVPKPLDSRVAPRVASAVARASASDGVAGNIIEDYEEYERSVAAKIAQSNGR